ncbi:hypothetical protein GZ77_00010 [Endozoicomonas montiporae]|uniref:Uncharacterized protein n=2 Tax=Endozoicomonas montiporae TaxID=1027273 RepID=A0A081N9K9_9GAMM|nr:hypothetical protein GZ77_00010 [Endozoicomonas montiporae]
MQYRFKSRVYVIISVGETEMIVSDRYDGEELHITKDEFYKSWMDDQIRLISGRISSSTKEKLKTPISTLSEKQKKSALRKETYIKKFVAEKDKLKIIGIGWSLAAPLLPQHPAYGSVLGVSVS